MEMGLISVFDILFQGIFVIQDNVPSAIFAYIEIVLDNLEQFSTANTVDKTETQVLE